MVLGIQFLVLAQGYNKVEGHRSPQTECYNFYQSWSAARLKSVASLVLGSEVAPKLSETKAFLLLALQIET